MFLFHEHQLTMLCICTKFNENICNGFKNIERTGRSKPYKGRAFCKTVGGVKILAAFYLMMLYICTNLMEISFTDFKVIEGT